MAQRAQEKMVFSVDYLRKTAVFVKKCMENTKNAVFFLRNGIFFVTLHPKNKTQQLC